MGRHSALRRGTAVVEKPAQACDARVLRSPSRNLLSDKAHIWDVPSASGDLLHRGTNLEREVPRAGADNGRVCTSIAAFNRILRGSWCAQGLLRHVHRLQPERI